VEDDSFTLSHLATVVVCRTPFATVLVLLVRYGADVADIPIPDIPILDIAAFRADESSAAGQRFVDDLLRACHEVGFAHLGGHGVDPDLAGSVLGLSRRFFALPDEDRMAIVNTNTPYFKGYTRLGMERTGGLPDWRDQIDIGPDHRPAPVLTADDPTWMRLRGPNQWPPALPDLRPTVVAWMDEMARLGDTVLRALALGLGQEADYFDQFMHPDPEVLVKIIRYPGRAERGQGVGPHHDSGLLTFIHQDDVGGLQVQAGGQFVDAPGVPGCYVLNLGEMLQLATEGYLRATRHQVITPPSGADRVSVAYFYNPRMEARMQPIVLPDHLAAAAPGGQNHNPADPVFDVYGENWLKFRLRSHPDVAAIHHADLLASQ
jgi:isopenicillin N synthase-like dioxygenase